MLLQPEHRDKLHETLWLFWAYLLVGLDNGLLGPCVPDLRQSVGVSLQFMSYIFLLQGFGALIGSLGALAPERHFDRRLLLGLYVLLGSVVNVVIPLKDNYYYLLVLFLLQGTFMGLTDYAAISLCNALWEENKALPFQFIIIGAGVGTFVAPLIAQPFLKAKVETSISASRDACPHDLPVNLTRPLMTSHPQVSHGGDVTDFYNATENAFRQLTNQSHGADLMTGVFINEDIIWPFIIAGLITVPPSLVFVYFYFTKPPLPRKAPMNTEREEIPAQKLTENSGLVTNSKAKPPTWAVCVFQGVLIFLHVPVFGLLVSLADLLTSIGMMPPFCMTAQEASYFPTVLWAASMVSRALGVLFLLCFSVFWYLLLNSVALVVLGGILLAGVRTHVVAMWVGTAGVGFFATNFMPGYLAWSAEYLPITPLFMNLCLCLAGMGEQVLPFVSGQLLAAFGPWVMMWLLMLVMLLMLVLFLCVVFLAERFL